MHIPNSVSVTLSVCESLTETQTLSVTVTVSECDRRRSDSWYTWYSDDRIRIEITLNKIPE